MSRWLYNSHGEPIAFISGQNAFSRTGKWLGQLEGDELWKGEYIGEIVNGDYLLARHSKPGYSKGVPSTPGTPGIPGVPGTRGGRGLPAGYTVIEFD